MLSQINTYLLELNKSIKISNIMKKIYIIILLLTLLSCKKGNEENKILLQNIEISSCFDLMDYSGECLKYASVDEQTLKFEQQFLVNSCFEKVTVDMVNDNNHIVMNVCDYGIQCSGICPVRVL
jgi:hypothetical protein